MNYKIDDNKEIYDSLIYNFESQLEPGCKDKRKAIAKLAKNMRDELGKKRDPYTKQYQAILDKIIKEYSKKLTTEEREKLWEQQKWDKIKKR